MGHFDKFLAQAQADGRSMTEILASAEAKAAAQRDDAEHGKRVAAFSKNEFISAFQANRRQAGSNNRGFEDHEEMMLAMSDPMYEKSEEYRAAVAEILMHTPAEVCGVSATATYSDGTSEQIGRKGLQTEVATKDTMLENAYRDYILEEMGKLDLSTAKGRYEYMKYLADPANAALVEYQESLVTSSEQRTHQAMLDSQASGAVDRTTIDMGDEVNDGTVPQVNFGVRE